MKGSLLWKLMYIFCALAGCLAGYGIFTLTSREEINPDTITKDNTLVREAEDSVFFTAEREEKAAPEPMVVPAVTATPVPVQKPEIRAVPGQEELPQITPEPMGVTPPAAMPEEPIETSENGQENIPDELPSLASQWAGTAVPVPVPGTPPVRVTDKADQRQSSATEAITYPARIFGQTPVINRSDTYVSYFEFAYDLISAMEPEVKQRGLNMNSLLAKFALKALFCGVDIEALDINAPIPRKMAALCLWLAAQVLNEGGSNTSARAAQKYVTDIGGCSGTERKAVAYLYEQGIVAGYQVPGQKFYPEAGLKTESGASWISGAKQCWN